MGLDISAGLVSGVLDGDDNAVLLFSSSSIAITPSLGSELITNGDFSAWTADDPDNWTLTGESGADPECSEVDDGETHGGTSAVGGFCNLYNSASAGDPQIEQTGIATVGQFYLGGVTLNAQAAGNLGWINAGNLNFLSSAATYLRAGRATDTNVALYAASANSDVTIDDATLKLISDTDLIFGDPTQYYGDWTINFSQSDIYHMAGAYACYEDANNWLLLYIWKNKAYLIQNVSGTVTELGSWSITYAADEDLTLRVHIDGTLDVLYKGATLVSGIADTGLRGTSGGAFLTSDSAITINSFTWDATGAT